MIILDTDIFTHLTFAHVNVLRHYEAVPEGEQIGVTVVTWMEVLKGRADSLLKAADQRELLAAAGRFRAAVAAFDDFQILQVDDEAGRHFTTLRSRKKLTKMKRPDLLIACVALAHAALLVTRNRKDFNQVTGLKLANWADD